MFGKGTSVFWRSSGIVFFSWRLLAKASTASSILEMADGSLCETCLPSWRMMVKRTAEATKMRLAKNITKMTMVFLPWLKSAKRPKISEGVLDILDLPSPDGADVEYWGCERRQLDDKLKRLLSQLGKRRRVSASPSGMAPSWYQRLLKSEGVRLFLGSQHIR